MKLFKKNQSGRSMVEMLGVLAVIGVLSVGGIAGYKYAMQRHQVNTYLERFSMIYNAVQFAYHQPNSYMSCCSYDSKTLNGNYFSTCNGGVDWRDEQQDEIISYLGNNYCTSTSNETTTAKYCYYGNATRADTDRRFGWKVYLFPRGNKAVFAISLILPYISYLNESVYADFVRSVEAHYSDTFLGFNTITENAWDPLPATEENIKARYAVNKGVAFYFAAPGMDQCEPEDE